MYVLKFRAAGHGSRALIAELIAGEIGRALGLPVPEIVLASLDRELARTEPDPEIHALLHDSAGLNLALDYLPGSVNYDPVVHRIAADLASRIVWFDAYVTNVDRTPRNTNMLMWHRAPWLIDHGSTLFFHHTPGWLADTARARAPFREIGKHVLLGSATAIDEQDEAMAQVLTPDVIGQIVAMVPEEWLVDGDAGTAASDIRAGYERYLRDRLTPPRAFVQEAAGVR
jgi:hypothetical protein